MAFKNISGASWTLLLFRIIISSKLAQKDCILHVNKETLMKISLDVRLSNTLLPYNSKQTGN
jgi:hypothetical protein